MVIFERIIIKNFYKVGNSPIEINLNSHKNTIVYGKNGSGKSSLFLESINFVLFGKAFRKITKQKMVNSINKKDTLVVLELTKGKDSYKIERGISPNIFKLYIKRGEEYELIPEMSSSDYQKFLENTIIGCDQKTFSQVQLLGSANHEPFMSLSAEKRRAFIESLLDLEIVKYMNDVAKLKIKTLKTDIVNLEHVKEKHELNIKSYNDFINTQKIEKKRFEDGEEDRINKIKTDVDELENKKLKIASSIDKEKLNQCHIKIEEYKREHEKLKNKKYLLKNNNEELKQKIEFFKTTDICPTCNSTLGDKQRNISINGMLVKISENDSTLTKINSAIEKYEDFITRVSNYIKKAENVEREILLIDREIKTKKDSLNKTKQNHEGIISEYEDKVAKEKEELSKVIEKYEKLIYKKRLHDESIKILKDDGIKATIIKKYIPLFNNLINKYLESLGLFVKFTLDENFNESVKSRHLDDYTYFSFSEGQKRRIDLAILFVFMEIARKRTGIDINLIIFDEILERVDDEGAELFMKILRSFKDNNFIIISHNENVIESFNSRDDRIVEISLSGEFTKLVTI